MLWGKRNRSGKTDPETTDRLRGGQKWTDKAPGLTVAVMKEAGCVLERHQELVKGALWTLCLKRV